MKNEYKIKGNIVEVKLQVTKEGKQLYTIIDYDDLPIIQEFNGTWYGLYSDITKTYYVRGNTLQDEDGKRRNIKMHRLIMGVVDSKVMVDHISRDTLDNRRLSNLRLATNKENQQNTKTQSPSGIAGITPHKGRWRVRITVEGKIKSFGVFAELEDAKRALDNAKKKHHPFYVSEG